MLRANLEADCEPRRIARKEDRILNDYTPNVFSRSFINTSVCCSRLALSTFPTGAGTRIDSNLASKLLLREAA
jgi:hypothetical protein